MLSRLFACLFLWLIAVTAPALAVTYNATPATWATILSNLASGDVVNVDPSVSPDDILPAVNWRGDHVFSPPVTFNMGSTKIAYLQFSSLDGVVWRGGVFWQNFGSGVYAMRGSLLNAKLIGVKAVGANTAFAFPGSTNLYVENMDGSGVQRDVLDLPNAQFTVVNGLYCHDSDLSTGAHPDCLQYWAHYGERPVSDNEATNVYVTGDSQGVSNFVHRELLTDGVATPDPWQLRMNIHDNIFWQTYPHGVTMGGCTEACQVVNNHGIATGTYKVQITPLTQSVAAANTFTGVVSGNVMELLNSGVNPGPWVPSITRYPTTDPYLPAGTTVLVGTAATGTKDYLALVGGVNMTPWASRLAATGAFAVKINGHPYTVTRVNLTGLLGFGAIVAAADAPWHASIVVQ